MILKYEYAIILITHYCVNCLVVFGGKIVAVCYNNLWKLLIDRNMNKTELKEAAGISFNVMARMGKNETISFESIEKICAALECNIGDIIEVVQEKADKNESSSFSTIELFAGAGGLALGIEKAGFNTIGLVEFDKDAADTLKCNRPNWRVINDDIANIYEEYSYYVDSSLTSIIYLDSAEYLFIKLYKLTESLHLINSSSYCFSIIFCTSVTFILLG